MMPGAREIGSLAISELPPSLLPDDVQALRFQVDLPYFDSELVTTIIMVDYTANLPSLSGYAKKE